MTSDQSPPLFYRLDLQDRICETGGAWDQFALENAGTELLGQSVIGRPLFDYISGDVSRMFVRTLLNGVRTLHRDRTIAYRCDSPGIRRHMEMTLSPGEAGTLLLQHRCVRLENQQPAVHFITASTHRAGLRIRCSHCNRVKIDGQWQEADALPAAAAVVHAQPVIYGVCGHCLDSVRRWRA